MNILGLDSIHDWRGKIVIVRAGMNVPIEEDGSIADDFRLERVLPTISYLRDQEAKIVVISHIGRDTHQTLEPVATYLQQTLPVVFKPEFFKDNLSQHIQELKQEIGQSDNGTIWLLDNLRQNPSEKENDMAIAQLLGDVGDVYVNESFSVSHREHMSMYALAQSIKPALAGYACEEEVTQLSLALRPPTGSIAVISGNKFDTKLPLINKFLNHYDTVVVGGALANTLYHLSGYEIGQSLYESDLDEETESSLRAILANEKLYLPAIVICSKGSGEKQAKHINEVEPDDYIYDIAPEGLIELEPLIAQSRLVVWNGPLGYYEGGYTEGTKRLLELLATSDTQSIVGGGNTVDAARDLGYEDQLSFLSTGGGAMIDFLTNGSLPALEQLRK